MKTKKMQNAILVDVKQRTDEWLDLRKTKLCASELSAIAGKNPYSNALDVLNNIRGKGEDLSNNPFVQMGNDFETTGLNKAINLVLEKKDKNDIVIIQSPVGYSNQTPELMSSFDALVSVNKGKNFYPFEIKTKIAKTFKEIDNDMDLIYDHIQIMAQSYTVGSDRGYIIYHCPELADKQGYDKDCFLVKCVMFDEKFFMPILEKGLDFYNTFINPKNTERDNLSLLVMGDEWTVYPYKEGDDIVNLISQISILKEKIKVLQNEEKTLVTLIKETLDQKGITNIKTEVGSVSQYLMSGRVDWKKVVDDLKAKFNISDSVIENIVKSFTGNPTTATRITPVKK